jgi:subtilisin family serine protease
MSARNTSPALSALVAVLAAFTVAGCNPGGSTSANSRATTQATPAESLDPAARQTSDKDQRTQGETDGSNNGVTTNHVVQFAGNPGQARPPEVSPDELLVKFKPGTPSVHIAAALPRATAVSIRSFALVPGLRYVKLAPGVTIDAALAAYRARSDVEYAEPNYIVHIDAVPNDPRFVEQWGLNNTGQTGGVVNADIDGPEAWNLTQGDSSVVVAVIDSGVDYTHPDLAPNIYRNTAECTPNGLDDDGNGYVDDCNGIDTANGDSDPADDNKHGTHVAGIIGAAGNNGLGVVGVAWNVKILPCKFIGADGTGNIADAIACLDYVAALAARGVNIVATNNSWSGGGFSQALADAIATQRQQGILFIAAAGNSLENHNYFRTYPCDYDAPNIICVAATTDSGLLAWFSDYGWHSVHVGAPGYQILSTLPGGTYGKLDGTSMAAPHVTGIAALLKAHDSTRDWRAIRNLILAGGKPNAALLNKTITLRQVSALGSLTCSNSIVREQLQPVWLEPMHRPGDPVLLRALHINCASPNGAPAVTVSPTGENVVLHDDGLAGDTAANDGIYSATWTSSVAGTYLLSFAGIGSVEVTFDEHLRPGFPQKTLTFGGFDFLAGPALHTLVGNMDADPELEIVRSALTVGPVYAWNHDGTRVSGWPPPAPPGWYVDGVVYPVMGRFTGSPNHFDVFANHSGIEEILTSSGQNLPGWPVWPHSRFPGSAADFDGDGLDEIIIDANDEVATNFMHVRRADATFLSGWPVTLPSSPLPFNMRTPAVADLFGDGELEIIATDMQRVYAYHRDGGLVAGFPVDLSATTVRSYPAVGDVDGDGAPEIVVLSQVQDSTHAAVLCILSNTGVIERTIVTPFEIAADVAPALADLDGDGIPEIVVQFDHLSSAGAIGVWRGTGTPLSGWPVSINDGSGNSAPVVGDVDGDGAPDIVVMTDERTVSNVRAYDHLGQSLTGFPKRLLSGAGAVPAIADLDLDGRNDVIVSGSQWSGYDGQYDTVWAFDLHGPPGNSPIEWGQFMSDEKHSGFYKTGKNLAAFAYLTTQMRGTGTITSSPAGIACGSDCIERYPKGTTVTLTAAGGTFGSWHGACEGQGNPCVVSIQDYTAVLADFGAFALSVSASGPGTVTSAPAGITCPGTCSATYGAGSVVTLTASPQAGAYFSGWSGACSGQTLSCSVRMSQARSVSATFSAKPTLSVALGGVGSGTVSSTPPGIDCGSDCSEIYDPGSLISLIARPEIGSAFQEWRGACSGTGNVCFVTMNDSQQATAIFGKQTARNLIVGKSGTGGGSVVSAPSGINCGADCTESYAQDTTIVLRAIPDAGSAFVNWSGACSGNELTCTLQVTGPVNIVATFTRLPPNFMLSVSKSGTGDGAVTSIPAGIDCGLDCSEAYAQDVVVLLEAKATANSLFSGWSGACAGTATTCSVNISAAKSVVASFTLKPVLTVAIGGSGNGTVTSTDSGIACGNDCNESYLPSTDVRLDALALAGSVFESWSGACSGTVPTCVVNMSAAKSVTANFAVKPVLTIALSGGGTGTVTSVDGGVSCGTDCTESYAPSLLITLNAAPAAGSTFDGWSGACTGQSTSCTVTMDASKSVGASFRVLPAPPSNGGGGGGGGGGRIDWTVLAIGATLLLFQLWSARRKSEGDPRGDRVRSSIRGRSTDGAGPAATGRNSRTSRWSVPAKWRGRVAAHGSGESACAAGACDGRARDHRRLGENAA